ncbi:MAG: transcriptional repressor [Planctomycetaceae bacterium]
MTPEEHYQLRSALHGIRKPSFEATVVLGEVFSDREASELITPDEIVQRLENSGYRISRATVYRAFRKLCRVGMLTIADDDAQPSRYRRIRLGD